MKVIYITLAIVSFLNFGVNKTCTAQWYQPEQVSKKARTMFDESRTLYQQGNYAEALEKINSAIKIAPKFIEAFASRATIFGDMKDYAASINDFQKTLELDSIFSRKYLYSYSISLAGLGYFDKALEKINQYLQVKNLTGQTLQMILARKECYEFAINYQANHPIKSSDFNPIDVGPGINSNDMEYYPSISIDGKKMVFTRRKNNNEDFWESYRENNQWQTATPLKGNLNTRLNEGAQCLSQDGNWIIFTGCNYVSSFGSCDLYISFKNKDSSWSPPQNLGETVNTDQWESSPSLSSDKKDLYFSSSRGSGLGGRDIWVTHNIGNNQWSYPENLGPTINTEGDEAYPFIHADNQTLYFSSNKHPGYGKSDLFVSRRQKDGSWGKPLNLGYPINTINDEGSLFVASDGQTAYYATEKLGKSNSDIFSFQLRKEISATPTQWINGRVYDKETNAGIFSNVEWVDLDNPNFSTSIQTDDKGFFLITLPIHREYLFNVNKKGYLFYSDHFSIQTNFIDSTNILNIPLEPIKPGASIILKNIFFATNEYSLQPESYSELFKVIELLKQNPNLKLEISGHTDNIGKKDDNIALSKNRAIAVMNYLTSNGISKDRLAIKGYGDSLPIADNATEDGRKQNRRTAIKVLSN